MASRIRAVPSPAAGKVAATAAAELPQVLVLNGPNLNLLGTRDPAHYGGTALAALERDLIEHGSSLGIGVICRQHNGEGELIGALHEARDMLGVIFNPAGYAHTSIALRDAMEAIAVPVIEVHISQIFSREGFRRVLVTAEAAEGVVAGLGTQGYHAALEALARRLKPGPA